MRKKQKPTLEQKRAEWLKSIDDNLKFEIIHSESDRGAVLVASGFIEEGLEHLLIAHLKKCNKSLTDKDLKGLFGVDRPLGTHSARTKLAYALNLITGDFRNALDRLRELRNDFSHRTKNEKPKLIRQDLARIQILLGTQGEGPVQMPDWRQFPPVTGNLINVARLQLLQIVWAILTFLQEASDAQNR
jgi:hypothetical protein